MNPIRQRGFTLIELLIAIALILAIAVTALPLLSRRLAPARLEAAQDAVRTVIDSARTDAMRSSSPIRLVAVIDARRTRLVGLPLDADLEDFAISLEGTDTLTADEQRARALAPRSVRTREYAALPEGFRLAAESAEEGLDAYDLSGDFGIDSPFAEEDPPPSERALRSAADPRPEVLTLAVLVPDGSVMSRDDLVLISDRGERRRLTIEPWTGRVTFDSVRTPGDPAADDPEAAYEDSDPFADPFAEDAVGFDDEAEPAGWDDTLPGDDGGRP